MVIEFLHFQCISFCVFFFIKSIGKFSNLQGNLAMLKRRKFIIIIGRRHSYRPQTSCIVDLCFQRDLCRHGLRSSSPYMDTKNEMNSKFFQEHSTKKIHAKCLKCRFLFPRSLKFFAIVIYKLTQFDLFEQVIYFSSWIFNSQTEV